MLTSTTANSKLVFRKIFNILLRFTFRRTSPRFLAQRYLLRFWSDCSWMADALLSFDIFPDVHLLVGVSADCPGTSTPKKAPKQNSPVRGLQICSGCMPLGTNSVCSSARFSTGGSNRVIKPEKPAVLQELDYCREALSGTKLFDILHCYA